MTFWQRAYNLKSETETTAASLNFSAHMENVGHEDNTIDKAVSNLGEAFAANSTVISQLTETNSTLHDHLNRNITDLQHQMASMNMALQNLVATRRGNTSTQNQRPIPLLALQAAQAHQAPTQASQAHQAPNWRNPTFVQQQPPPIPLFPPTQQRGGGAIFADADVADVVDVQISMDNKAILCSTIHQTHSINHFNTMRKQYRP